MQEVIKELLEPNQSKLILLVMDGLGGLPHPESGKTELETADTPNLNELARISTCGLSEPIAPGITPGSGPAHLSIFGYNPLKYEIKRGVLEALGIEFPLQDQDVAIRANFASLENALITDRRAGRISTETCTKLCEKLSTISLPGVEIFVKPVKEHRAVLIFRGEGLHDEVSDTDPQQVGLAPLLPTALDSRSEKTAVVAQNFLEKAKVLLSEEKPANFILLRGFSSHPKIPLFPEVYRLKAAAIAEYPMYRGLGSLLGMEVLPLPSEMGAEFAQLKANYQSYDFFFIHIKKTDSYGEDGNFESKVKMIETVDKRIPELLSLKPDCLVVTGDHSTPAVLKAHSWHPVPFLLYSPFARRDKLAAFGESECGKGSLGKFPALQIMPLMLAHGFRLKKFGA